MYPIQTLSKVAGKVPAAGPLAVVTFTAEAVALVRSILDHRAELHRIEAIRQQNELQAEVELRRIESEYNSRMADLYASVEHVQQVQLRGQAHIETLHFRRDEVLAAMLAMSERSMNPSLTPEQRKQAVELCTVFSTLHRNMGMEQSTTFDRMAESVDQFVANPRGGRP